MFPLFSIRRISLKRRSAVPASAIHRWALGFWKAIDEVWRKIRAQRCWLHKTANVLNRLPESLEAMAKHELRTSPAQLRLGAIFKLVQAAEKVGTVSAVTTSCRKSSWV